MKTAVKIINLIRGRNTCKSLSHCKFWAFLEEMDLTYEDLLLHSEVRWLSAGECLERFFALRNKMPTFFSNYVKPDPNALEVQLRDREFLKELAHLTDITGHLNDIKTKLQGNDQTVPSLFGNVNGFRNKLSLFNTCLGKSDLSHFPSCKDLAEELKDFGGSELSTLLL
jgi:hypothetical protein